MMEAIKDVQFHNSGLTNFKFFENFFSPILFKNSIILDGAGNEKPPVEELKSEKEAISPEVKDTPKYLCDRILHHDLNEGIGSLFDIGREILKAAYSKNHTYTKLTQKPLTSYVVDSNEPVIKPVSLSRQTSVTVSKPLENYSGVISYNKTDDTFTIVSYSKEIEYGGTYDSNVLDYSQQTYISTDPGLLTYKTLQYEPFQKESDTKQYSITSNFELPSFIEAKPLQEYSSRPELKREIETQNYSFTKPFELKYDSIINSTNYETNISQLNVPKTELKIPEVSFSENNLLENIIDSTPKSDININNESLDYHFSQILSNSEAKTEDYVLTSEKEETLDSKPIMQSKEESNYLETAKLIPLTPRLKGFVNDKSSGIDLELKLKPEEPENHQLKQEPKYFQDSVKSKAKNCESTSDCYEEILAWIDGKDVNLSEEKLKSLSQCYAAEISKIKKAREYIKKRTNKYSCTGSLKNLFHHNDPNFKLKDYIRNGKVQEGFKLAEKVVAEVNEEDKQTYNIKATNTNTGKTVNYSVEGDSLYAYLDKNLKSKIIWKDFSFIDTETGKERSGIYWDEKYKEMKSCLYLETIAQYHVEANKLLGNKDQFGMKLNGIIILINGEEPGKGTKSLFDHKVRSGDVIEVVYKNDAAIYKSNGPSLKKAA